MPPGPDRVAHLAEATWGLALAFSILLILLGVAWNEAVVTGAGFSVALGSTALFLAACFVDWDRERPDELLKCYLRDEQHLLSLARVQLFLWVAIVIFAFTWFTVVRVLLGVPAFSGSFPPNLLGILAFSTGSAVVSAQISRQRQELLKRAPKQWRALLDEVSNGELRPSLGRFQMLGWTIVSIGIYVFLVSSSAYQVLIHGSAGSLSIPELDPTLVALMGVSHACYLGSKYVTTSPGQNHPDTAGSQGSVSVWLPGNG